MDLAAVDAVTELLTRLRLDFMFVGAVARAAWLGEETDGAVDVVALMQPQQKNQVAMMAANRGFRVERQEVEESEELDLIPLHFGPTRVHVLVASNALYGRMFSAAQSRPLGGREVKVPAREDYALLLALADDFDTVRELSRQPEFDRTRYEQLLRSIGLSRFTQS